MGFVTTQCTIKTADMNAANFATNTFTAEVPDLADIQDWHNALAVFYQAVDLFFSDLTASTAGLRVVSYDRADPEPRAPIHETSTNLTPGGGAPLPPEVSLCLSFQGARISGVPQARRRGRVYLPFFGESGNHTDGRPVGSMVTAIVAAGETLMDTGPSDGTWQWLVWSSVEPGYTIVTDGWVDNEWDTQRRRGRDYTVRTLFP